MKFPSFMILVAVSGVAVADPTPTTGLGIQCLPQNLPPPACDSTTDAQLQAMQDAGKFGGVAGPDFHRETWDLEGHSQYIHFNNDTVILPKGAILNVPKKFKDNIVDSITGTLMSWPDFLAKYRGSLSFFDVDIPQASGQKDLDPTRFKAACGTNTIVIAVYNRNPISVVRRAAATKDATPPLNPATPKP